MRMDGKHSCKRYVDQIGICRSDALGSPLVEGVWIHQRAVSLLVLSLQYQSMPSLRSDERGNTSYRQLDIFSGFCLR